MKNIWRLFVGDVKRLTTNVVTGIIVLGLVFIPSIFSWYNVLACWDVFNNTGNLTVAVANTDEGYASDLVPLEINIGEKVVSALRANDQLNWTFTSEEDAIDGARSGKYYAAVVIPSSFSKDMMTFYSDEVEHAKIVYYTNEKKSAVAPKVTDQGADRVSYQVNEVFAETMSEVALGIATSLSDYTDKADATGRIGSLAGHVGTMSTQMRQVSAVLGTYSSLIDAAQSLISGSASLISQAKSAANDVADTAAGGRQAVSDIADAMSASADALAYAIHTSSESYVGLSDSIDQAFADTDTLANDSADQLDSAAAAADAQIVRYQEIVTQLEDLKSTVGPDYESVVQMLIDHLNTSIEMQQSLSSAMSRAAVDIRANNGDAQAQHEEIKELAAEAEQSIEELSTSYDETIKPQLDELAYEMGIVVDSLKSSTSKLASVGETLAGSAGSISSELSNAKQQLDNTACDLNAAADELSTLSDTMLQVLASGDIQALKQLLGSDPAALAAALAAPVQLDRQAVFPASSFGSQMAPLYTTLAMWIGALLLVVAIRVVVSDKAQEELDDPKLYQLFLGRFGVFAVISFLQTTCMALGNMFFLDVQVNEPLLYLVCFWGAGLVFTFFIYSMVVAFANLGKAIAVLLLIIQVTSGGGSFPLQLLPDFFQIVSPYLPATHVINAMRAAMMGVYQNDFWIQMGELALFMIPAALLGLVLRKPLMKFLNWYIEKVEDSKLVA